MNNNKLKPHKGNMLKSPHDGWKMIVEQEESIMHLTGHVYFDNSKIQILSLRSIDEYLIIYNLF